MTMDVSAGAAFLAGLLSFLSPCVLPLVPAYLCYMAGVSAADLSVERPIAQQGRMILTALAFVAGFTVVFTALGATASAFGKVVGAHLSTLTAVAGALVIVMGLHFLGIIRIPLMYRSATMTLDAKPASPVGAFLLGLAFAFGWTPCAGPVLAAILFMAGAEDTITRGVWLLLSYAAGLGAPFILAAAFTGFFMKGLGRFRRFLGAMEKATGVFLVAMGLAFLSGSMPAVSAWLLEHFPVLGTIG